MKQIPTSTKRGFCRKVDLNTGTVQYCIFSKLLEGQTGYVADMAGNLRPLDHSYEWVELWMSKNYINESIYLYSHLYNAPFTTFATIEEKIREIAEWIDNG